MIQVEKRKRQKQRDGEMVDKKKMEGRWWIGRKQKVEDNAQEENGVEEMVV